MILSARTKAAGIISLLAVALAIGAIFFGAVVGAGNSLRLALTAFGASIVSVISAYVVWRHLKADPHHKAREDYLRHH